jgi:hypothetical protein
MEKFPWLYFDFHCQNPLKLFYADVSPHLVARAYTLYVDSFGVLVHICKVWFDSKKVLESRISFARDSHPDKVRSDRTMSDWVSLPQFSFALFFYLLHSTTSLSILMQSCVDVCQESCKPLGIS